MEHTPQVWRRFFGSWVLTVKNSHFGPLVIILVEVKINVGILWVPLTHPLKHPLRKDFSKWGAQSFPTTSAYSIIKVNDTMADFVHKVKQTYILSHNDL